MLVRLAGGIFDSVGISSVRLALCVDMWDRPRYVCVGIFKNSDSRKLANTRCLGMYWPAAMEVIRGRRSIAEWSTTKCRQRL